METSSIVFNSKHLSKVCIQHFSPFDIKSNVQLAKKKTKLRLKAQLWRVILSSEFLLKNKIFTGNQSMSILLHVLLLHLKKPLNGSSN